MSLNDFSGRQARGRFVRWHLLPPVPQDVFAPQDPALAISDDLDTVMAVAREYLETRYGWTDDLLIDPIKGTIEHPRGIGHQLMLLDAWEADDDDTAE